MEIAAATGNPLFNPTLTLLPNQTIFLAQEIKLFSFTELFPFLQNRFPNTQGGVPYKRVSISAASNVVKVSGDA